MAIYTSTITISVLIMLILSAVTSAEDMSIISYNEEHHTKGGEWRTDEEIMALYESWLVENKKVYNALGEKDKRFLIFKDNLKYIDEVNTKPNKTYKLGPTKFADLTNEEYKSMYLATMVNDPSISSSITQSDHYAPKVGDIVPDSIDWREKGVLVGVKDQGQCGGGSWAFAAITTIEAINKLVTGLLVRLSEQQVIDCETTHSYGCRGGYLHRALIYVRDNGGVDLSSNYPNGAQTGTCNENALKYASIDSYQWVPSHNETRLKEVVANHPVAVSIDASSRDFQLYKEGIFTGSCSPSVDTLNHAVVAVGYGTSENGMDYWIVRNSWGANWGDGGYIKMQRNIASSEGLCGIATRCFYPIKRSPNPPNICPSTVAWCSPADRTCCCTGSNCICCFPPANACCASGSGCCSPDQMSKKAPMESIILAKSLEFSQILYEGK